MSFLLNETGERLACILPLTILNTVVILPESFGH